MVIWSITDIVRTIPDGVVETINYRAEINDGSVLVYSYGTVAVPYKSPTDPSFIAFDSLTEQEIIQWVKERVDVNKIEEVLNKSFNEKKNPTQANGLPW